MHQQSQLQIRFKLVKLSSTFVLNICTVLFSGHQRAAGDDQEHRVRHHRQGLRHGMDQAGPARKANGETRRHRRVGTLRTRGSRSGNSPP